MFILSDYHDLVFEPRMLSAVGDDIMNVMNDRREALSNLIIKKRDEYVEQFSLASYSEINDGLCTSFADDIIAEMKEMFGGDVPDIQDIEIANFLEVDSETGLINDSGSPFDKGLISEFWPNVTPPEGLDWQAMDRLSELAEYGPGTHVFIEMDGLFFDSECPSGTNNFFELPFFRRMIDHFVESGDFENSFQKSPIL